MAGHRRGGKVSSVVGVNSLPNGSAEDEGGTLNNLLKIRHAGAPLTKARMWKRRKGGQRPEVIQLFLGEYKLQL